MTRADWPRPPRYTFLPADPTDPPIALSALSAQEITDIDPSQPTTFGEDATLAVAAGYDDATDLGAPVDLVRQRPRQALTNEVWSGEPISTYYHRLPGSAPA